MHRKVLKTVLILLLISVGYVSTDIYLPSLPKIADYFSVNEGLVQMTLFSYLISFSFSPLIFGPLSDNIGRKKVIFIGLLITLFSTISCYLAQNITWLITARFFQGIGTGAILISARSMIIDLYSGKELAKQFSYITMFMPIILATAPTIGGLLQENFGWQSVFMFLIGYIIFIILYVSPSSESIKVLHRRTVSEVYRGYIDVLKNRPFLLYGMGMVIPTFGMFAYLTASPFLFQEVIGLSPAQYGSLSIYIGACVMLTSFLNAKLIHYFDVKTMIRLGSALIVLAGALLLFFNQMGILNTWTLLIPAMLLFCCLPFCISNSGSKSATQIKSHFGSAYGLLTTVQFLAGAFASFIFSMIPDVDAFPLAICFLLVGILSLVNLYFASRFEERNAS